MLKQFFVPFLSALVSLILLDLLWLTALKDFYLNQLSHLLNESPKLFPILIFYLLYALGLTLFIVIPTLQDQASPLSIITKGLLLGLVTYGAYDLVNFATLKDWPFSITAVDMAWGAVLTILTSLISVYISRYIYSNF